MRSFPYGNAALALLVLALCSGIWIAARPVDQKPATLVYWTFSKDHYDAYQLAAQEFEQQNPGVTIDIQLVSNAALASRLEAAMLADLDVPDMTELEIGTAGMMFRGPVKDIGFIDLKPYLQQSGLYNRIVASRLAPYTTRGHIFGLPQDVHPVQLAYRRDLFEQLHIDPTQLKTWADFIKVGERVTDPVGGPDGQHKRYMIELDDGGVYQGSFETILLQRNLDPASPDPQPAGYFDEQGNCIIDNESAVQAMKFFVPLIAGPHRIGFTQGDFWGGGFSKAVEQGLDLCYICPDWRTKNISNNIPSMAGKMALMPLPAVAPGLRNTSTWGGTMLGITKHCKNPDLAWKFAMFLYTDPTLIPELFKQTNILPPVKDFWTAPWLKERDPYWSNQERGYLYAQLAPKVPPQYTRPEIDLAKRRLGEALVACRDYYASRNGNVNDADFTNFIRATLHAKANEVRVYMARNNFHE